MVKLIDESIDDMQPEIVKDRGGKICKETRDKLDRITRYNAVTLDQYAYTLNKDEKSADMTLLKLVNDVSEALKQLDDYKRIVYRRANNL